MLTVPEAARRVGRDAETVRRWIRSGRLRAEKVGLQYLIDVDDLEQAASEGVALPLPREWRRTWTGEPYLDWVRRIRESRRGH